jgi:hypothetical protein
LRHRSPKRSQGSAAGTAKSDRIALVGPLTSLGKAVRRRAQRIGVSTDWFPVDHVLDGVRIHDRIDASGAARVRWALGDAVLTKDSHRGILNSLVRPPPEVLTRLDERDRTYVSAEIASYLGFFLGVLPNVINRPSNRWLPGWVDTLPNQWSLVRSWKLPIRVPRHEFTTGPGKSDFRPRAIETENPFATGNWAHRPRRTSRRGRLRLRYERPRGKAVACWFVDGESIVSTIDTSSSKNTIGSRHPPLVRAMVERLRVTYGLRMGRAIVFSAKDGLVFGGISPFVGFDHMPSEVRPLFVAMLVRALTDA